MSKTLSERIQDTGDADEGVAAHLKAVPLLLTTGDASHVLTVSPVWVHELVERGEIRPVARTVKRRADGQVIVALYFDPQDVQDLHRRRNGDRRGQMELPLLREVRGVRRG